MALVTVGKSTDALPEAEAPITSSRLNRSSSFCTGARSVITTRNVSVPALPSQEKLRGSNLVTPGVSSAPVGVPRDAGADHGAVLGRDGVEVVEELQAAAAGDVLHGDGRLAGDVPAHVARDGAGDQVIAAARGRADAQLDGLAFVEGRDLVLRGGGERCEHKQREQTTR